MNKYLSFVQIAATVFQRCKQDFKTKTSKIFQEMTRLFCEDQNQDFCMLSAHFAENRYK